MDKKIAILGAGRVGASVAYAALLQRLCAEIVLVDIETDKAEGEALDIAHGIHWAGDVRIYAGSFADCRNADVFVLAAGQNRKPGQSRRDLLETNLDIATDAAARVETESGHWIVLTNPVDPLVYCLQRRLPRATVLSTGCMLDSSRFLRLLASRLGVSLSRLYGFVAGEHGDGQFPLWSSTSVDGTPLELFCARNGLRWTIEERLRIEQAMRAMGDTIIQKKGATHFGVATCTAALLDALLHDRGTVASVCSTLHGEYGLEDVALSVPRIVHGAGVEDWNEWPLSEEEHARLCASAERLRAFNLGFVR